MFGARRSGQLLRSRSCRPHAPAEDAENADLPVAICNDCVKPKHSTAIFQCGFLAGGHLGREAALHQQTPFNTTKSTPLPHNTMNLLIDATTLILSMLNLHWPLIEFDRSFLVQYGS
jgi:hypothetical protein